MKKLLMLLTICLALLCLCLPALAEVEIEIVDANYIRLPQEGGMKMRFRNTDKWTFVTNDNLNEHLDLVLARGGTEEEIRRMDEAEAVLNEKYGDKLAVFRAGPRMIDVQAKGVSKAVAARRLQQQMGRKILVCMGDAENDVVMLDGADYAFVPADAILKDRYENVCQCADGAVADVIYEKIPAIVKNNLDKRG